MKRPFGLLQRRRVVIVLLLIALGGCGLWGGIWLTEGLKYRQYFSLRETVRPLIEELADECPDDVSPAVWQQVIVYSTDTAIGNVFFKPEDASYEELKTFVKDLEKARSLEPKERVRWIWKQLERVEGNKAEIERRLKNLRSLMEENASFTFSAEDQKKQTGKPKER
jgi:hypothetical protein